MNDPRTTTTDRLHQIPALVQLLPIAAHTRTPPTGGGRPVPASKPPTRLDIIDLTDYRQKVDWEQGMADVDPARLGVGPYLNGWCKDIEAAAYEQLPDVDQLLADAPAGASVDKSCAWLAHHLGVAQAIDLLEPLADGVRRVHQSLLDATAAVRDPDPTPPAVCNSCHEGNLEPVKPGMWTCTWCAKVVTVEAVTIPEAHKRIRDADAKVGQKPIGLATLYRWADSGRFTRLAVAGGSLYDLGTIRREVAQWRIRRGKANQ